MTNDEPVREDVVRAVAAAVQDPEVRDETRIEMLMDASPAERAAVADIHGALADRSWLRARGLAQALLILGPRWYARDPRPLGAILKTIPVTWPTGCRRCCTCTAGARRTAYRRVRGEPVHPASSAAGADLGRALAEGRFLHLRGDLLPQGSGSDLAAALQLSHELGGEHWRRALAAGFHDVAMLLGQPEVAEQVSAVARKLLTRPTLRGAELDEICARAALA